MRLRNIPGSREFIAASPWCVQVPGQWKGNWQSVFENDNPIHLEIGMGKGQFLITLAKMNPDINYVGIEKYSSVLLRGLQKLEQEPLSNIRFMRAEAEYICDIFEKNEVFKIYLNFSDPWPKDRHTKRRLTSRQFFSRYDQILVPSGTVEFKTDNAQLFAFSLKEVTEARWHLDAFTHDLHHDHGMAEGNVMTEYEERFSSQGNQIHKLIASR